MATREGEFTDIDQNIAANLRTYREAGNISQEELAQRMTDRGFGFSQATIWKIENGQRPVKASELVALADSLEVMSVISLTYEPGTARHHARMRRANRKALDAYGTLKEAAVAYLEAQLEVLFAAREAHDDGVTVTELYTSWLGIPAERAVIEARIQTDQEETQAQQIDDSVDKVLDALRTAGYEPSLRIEDVEYEGGDHPLPVWTPHSRPTREYTGQPGRSVAAWPNSGSPPWARCCPSRTPSPARCRYGTPQRRRLAWASTCSSRGVPASSRSVPASRRGIARSCRQAVGPFL